MHPAGPLNELTREPLRYVRQQRFHLLTWQKRVMMSFRQRVITAISDFIRYDLSYLVVKLVLLIPLVYLIFRTKVPLFWIVLAGGFTVNTVAIVSLLKNHWQRCRPLRKTYTGERHLQSALWWDVVWPFVFGLLLSLVLREYTMFLAMVIISGQGLGRIFIRHRSGL